MKVSKIKAQEAEDVWSKAILECEYWINLFVCMERKKYEHSLF